MESAAVPARPYHGRIAPTPTGHLHLGHAATFAVAHERARVAGGHVTLRMDDLDPLRCKPEFVADAIEDLRWLGLDWDAGPVCQSQRRDAYIETWRRLRDGGWIYPCSRSRRDVAAAAHAPHEEEPIYPVEWRRSAGEALAWEQPAGINWRFRVPEEEVAFVDGHFGEIRRNGQRDFGDFVIWNRDDIPAYELAVVVDDLAMGITEVVRGADLLTSTARQLLLYRALGGTPPQFFHCPLLLDNEGRRLAKRDAALSIRTLRESGWTREKVMAEAGKWKRETSQKR